MQPVLHFVVNNQIIARTDTFAPVRNSKNYLYAEFEFLTDDWAGKSRTALFRSGDSEPIAILLGETETTEDSYPVTCRNHIGRWRNRFSAKR